MNAASFQGPASRFVGTLMAIGPGIVITGLGSGFGQPIKTQMRPGRWGFPEPVQRMHWDEEWAKKVGSPMSYDYGMMRAAWTINYLTNWMGDDAWLWKLECEMRKFNYHGYVQWFHGKVAREFKEGTR